jgi:hypothetical protein
LLSSNGAVSSKNRRPTCQFIGAIKGCSLMAFG